MVYYFECHNFKGKKDTNDTYVLNLGDKVFSKRSKYQQIDVFKSPIYGKVLLLDGVIQQAELDEACYHEPLVHVPMAFHPNPEEVLVLGGGDGCAVREILKHPTVKRVVLVDIDEDMIKHVGKEQYADINEDALDDERVEVHAMDAKEYVEKSQDKFDVIYMDLVDPYHEQSTSLYAPSQISKYKKRLKNGGVLASHLEMPDPPFYTSQRVFSFIKQNFEHGLLYLHNVKSFAAAWGFGVFSDDIDFYSDDAKQRISEKFAALDPSLRALDKEYAHALYYLPKWVRNKIKEFEASKETKILLDMESGAFSELEIKGMMGRTKLKIAENM